MEYVEPMTNLDERVQRAKEIAQQTDPQGFWPPIAVELATAVVELAEELSVWQKCVDSHAKGKQNDTESINNLMRDIAYNQERIQELEAQLAERSKWPSTRMAAQLATARKLIERAAQVSYSEEWEQDADQFLKETAESHEHSFDTLRIRDDDGAIFSVCLQCGARKYEDLRETEGR